MYAACYQSIVEMDKAKKYALKVLNLAEFFTNLISGILDYRKDSL